MLLTIALTYTLRGATCTVLLFNGQTEHLRFELVDLLSAAVCIQLSGNTRIYTFYLLLIQYLTAAAIHAA